MRTLAPLSIMIALVLLGWTGCSEDGSDAARDAGNGHNEDDACGVIATRCHPYAAEPEAATCHDLGHAATPDVEACAAALDECLTICPELDAGTSDAGGSDAAGDASADACVSYCECMLPTCGEQLGGDFADNAACLARCATFDATELSCWSGFCDTARAGTSVSHNCDHAAGALGLDECP